MYVAGLHDSVRTDVHVFQCPACAVLLFDDLRQLEGTQLSKILWLAFGDGDYTGFRHGAGDCIQDGGNLGAHVLTGITTLVMHTAVLLSEWLLHTESFMRIAYIPPDELVQKRWQSELLLLRRREW